MPAAAHVSEAADSTRDVAQEDFLFHLYRGSELLQENRVLEAKEELEFALTMQPFDPKGQDLLGAVYFRLGLYPRAIQIYEGLCLQFARDVSVKINLALCYLKTGQPEPARRTLQDAVRLNPEHKRAWGYLGLALQKLGELEQAQIAFERGGQTLMAKRMTERRQRVTVPAPEDIAASVEIDEGVRNVAETAFSELDAGELRFALAEPGTPQTGPWHTLELGDAIARPKSPYARTQPPPSVRDQAMTHESVTAPPPSRAALLGESPAASTRLVPPPPQPLSLKSPPPPADLGEMSAPSTEQVAAPAPRSTTPSLLALPPDRAVAVHSSGALLARATEEFPFAARLEALRVISGTVSTRALHRRSRDADSADVLGGIGSPMVRISGSAQLVLGPRPGHEVAVLTLDEGLAFLREDAILGFELRLSYENGRLAPDAPGDTPRAAAEGIHLVQIRGTGAVALELARKLASVPCAAGRSLTVRREWIVGWIGRLVPRALPPADAPSGQRGLVGFSGEGTVLVCAG